MVFISRMDVKLSNEKNHGSGNTSKRAQKGQAFLRPKDYTYRLLILHCENFRNEEFRKG
jgi:hypothetical protein